jgi:hypothetical protein
MPVTRGFVKSILREQSGKNQNHGEEDETLNLEEIQAGGNFRHFHLQSGRLLDSPIDPSETETT